VFGDARVSENAQVSGYAKVYKDTLDRFCGVNGDALVFENAPQVQISDCVFRDDPQLERLRDRVSARVPRATCTSVMGSLHVILYRYLSSSSFIEVTFSGLDHRGADQYPMIEEQIVATLKAYLQGDD
jgi:hypothetical protein